MAITGTQQPESPSIQQQANGNKVYTRVFKYDNAYNWEAEMPTLGVFDATYGYFRGYSSSKGPAYTTVTLSYDTEGSTTNFTPADGDTEYWAQTTGEETPVEYHPDYRTRWNYGLYVLNDKTPTRDITEYPATGGEAAGVDSYEASTTPDDLAAETKIGWFKDHPGATWIRIKKPIKGNDFYLRPSRATFERNYHRDKSDAENDLQDVGKLVNPSEDFGASTTTPPFNVADQDDFPFKTNPGKWLVVASNTVYDGKYWVTETEFRHSEEGWDGTLYEAP